MSACDKCGQPRARAYVRQGSIVLSETASGNMHISKTHTPGESIMIERMDFDDLAVAIYSFTRMMRL